MPGNESERDKAPAEPVRIFVSYAAEDDTHRSALERHLRLLEREGFVETWTDRKILPGDQWGKAIDERLESADLVLLLVSEHFINSDYCYTVEMTRALERHQQNQARVVPILVDSYDWQSAPFAKLQVLPERARPVTSWENAADAWTSVARGLRAIVEQFRPALARARAGAPQLARYLEGVRDDHLSVELRGMGAKVVEKLELREVYTRLRVAAPGGERERQGSKDDAVAPRLDRDLSLSDVLAAHPHAVLIGDPGSGKTTFLRFVAQSLARAGLGDGGALQKVGLTDTGLVPVFVELHKLASFLRDDQVDLVADAPERFYRYLDHLLAGQHTLPRTALRERVLAGSAFLLLDGLDEVPGDDARGGMIDLIERVVGEGRGWGNRHLVTTRTRAYQGRVQFQKHFEAFQLAPFGPQEVESFVRSWSRALHRVRERPDAADRAESYRKELGDAIRASEGARVLTENPLMLTMLAIVHWNRRKLPQQRVELYEDVVSYLLESRREQSSWSVATRLEALRALAIGMFEHPEGVERRVDREEAEALVRPFVGEGAGRFLDEEALWSGILVSRSEGQVEFWHLTFQEYLAALELASEDDQEDAWRRLRDRLYDDRWAEVVLLYAGCRRRSGLRSASRFIQEILAGGRRAAARAGLGGLVGRIVQKVLGGGSARDRKSVV